MAEKAPLIYSKMSAVMGDIKPIAKDRDNKQQGFKFRGIDDVYNALHPILSKHGVFYVPTVLKETYIERKTSSGKVMYGCVAKVKFTFYAEDGSHVIAVTIGKGEDMGDKETNKALAGACKYALVMSFAIPTEGVLDDGDAESPEASEADKKTDKPKADQKADTDKPTAAQTDKLKELFSALDIKEGSDKLEYINELLEAEGQPKIDKLGNVTKKLASKVIDKLIQDIEVIKASAKSAPEPF